MNPAIVDFLKKQNCASICCVDEAGKPHCFSCFYAFDEGARFLYFKSAAHARHALLMKENRFVSGTMLPDKLNKLAIRGIQFEGIVLDSQHPGVQQTSGTYFKKHPVALAIPGEIWTIQVNSIKMTDSTLGFGKKLFWERAPTAADLLSAC